MVAQRLAANPWIQWKRGNDRSRVKESAAKSGEHFLMGLSSVLV